MRPCIYVLVQVAFKVTRPKPSTAGGSGPLDVGQWAECVAKINVAGGAKCSGVPDKQAIAVRLRAFVFV